MSKAARVENSLRYGVLLKYSYFVGEYRSSEHVQEFSKEADADDFARQMKDKKIQVHVNPDNPNESAIQQSTIEQFILLTPRFG